MPTLQALSYARGWMFGRDLVTLRPISHEIGERAGQHSTAKAGRSSGLWTLFPAFVGAATPYSFFVCVSFWSLGGLPRVFLSLSGYIHYLRHQCLWFALQQHRHAMLAG